MKNNGRSPL